MCPSSDQMQMVLETPEAGNREHGWIGWICSLSGFSPLGSWRRGVTPWVDILEPVETPGYFKFILYEQYLKSDLTSSSNYIVNTQSARF